MCGFQENLLDWPAQKNTHAILYGFCLAEKMCTNLRIGVIEFRNVKLMVTN